MHGIAISRSSTAAVGYVFLPFVSVAVAVASFVILAALLYLGRSLSDALGWSKKITTLRVGLISFAIVGLASLLATLHFARERLLEDARSATTPTEFTALVEKTAKRSDWKTLALLARNRNASPETLERIYAILQTSPRPQEYSVSYALATNPHTPPQILQKLSALPEASIAISLATNPNTPADTVNQLADNPHWLVRNRVTSNPLLTRENLQRLTTDRDKLVRENASLNLQRRGIPGDLDLSDETLLAFSRRASEGDLAAVDELVALYVKARDTTPQDSAARRNGLRAISEGVHPPRSKRRPRSTRLDFPKIRHRQAGYPRLWHQSPRAGCRRGKRRRHGAAFELREKRLAPLLRRFRHDPPGLGKHAASRRVLQKVISDPKSKPLWRMASMGLEGAAAKGNTAAAAAVADYKQRSATQSPRHDSDISPGLDRPVLNCLPPRVGQ